MSGLDGGIDLDAIRADVAKRHNVLVGKDDPVMVVVTLNDHVISHYLARVEASMVAHEQRSAARFVQEVEGVKRAAEGLIGGSAAYAAEQIRVAADEARSRVLVAIDSHVAGVQGRLAEAVASASRVDAARRGAWTAAAVAGAALLLTIGLLAGLALR